MKTKKGLLGILIAIFIFGSMLIGTSAWIVHGNTLTSITGHRIEISRMNSPFSLTRYLKEWDGVEKIYKLNIFNMLGPLTGKAFVEYSPKKGIECIFRHGKLYMVADSGTISIRNIMRHKWEHGMPRSQCPEFTWAEELLERTRQRYAPIIQANATLTK